jgi:hypothetical protein
VKSGCEETDSFVAHWPLWLLAKANPSFEGRKQEQEQEQERVPRRETEESEAMQRGVFNKAPAKRK